MSKTNIYLATVAMALPVACHTTNTGDPNRENGKIARAQSACPGEGTRGSGNRPPGTGNHP